MTAVDWVRFILIICGLSAALFAAVVAVVVMLDDVLGEVNCEESTDETRGKDPDQGSGARVPVMGMQELRTGQRRVHSGPVPVVLDPKGDEECKSGS